MKCPYCNKYLKVKIELDENQEWNKLMDEITEFNIKARADWWYHMNLYKILNKKESSQSDKEK